MRRRIFSWILWPALFVILFLFLQLTKAFHFFYIEQFQLFQFTWDYVQRLFVTVGGVSQWIGEWMVQFFMVPYAGAAVTALLLTLAGLLTQQIVRRIAPSVNLPLLYLLPVLTLLLLHFNFNYLYWGTVAFLLMECAFLLYLYTTPRWRIALSIVLVPLLFWMAGAAAVVFLLSIVIYEMFCPSRSRYLIVFPVIELLAIVLLSVVTGWADGLKFATLPDAFYSHKLTAPHLFYAPWILMLLIVAISCLLRNRIIRKRRTELCSVGLQLFVFVALCYGFIPKYEDSDSYPLKKLDYYTRMQQWDKIIDMSRGTLHNYLYMCYLNMALVEKGQLASRMFEFDQRGIQGLMVEWNETYVSSSLLAEQYFSIGETAMAQRMAFEAFVSGSGSGNARFLKRLVQTNLVFGQYRVAEKYIKILENTFFYKNWARAQRRFLNNDDAVSKDKRLGRLRRELPTESRLTYLDGIGPDLMRRAEAHPENRTPIELIGASLLLTKSVKEFKQLIEQCAGTRVLPVLPKSFQEAVVLCFENQPALWQQYGVSAAVVNRFAIYRQKLLQNRRMLASFEGEAYRNFGDTYWFYYSFK